MTNDLDLTVRDNETRRGRQREFRAADDAISLGWKALACVRTDAAPETIDALVAEVRELRERTRRSEVNVTRVLDGQRATIDALVSELKVTRSILDHANLEWAEEESKIRALCTRVLSAEQGEGGGDGECVPDLSRLVELLVTNVTVLRTTAVTSAAQIGALAAARAEREEWKNDALRWFEEAAQSARTIAALRAEIKDRADTEHSLVLTLLEVCAREDTLRAERDCYKAALDARVALGEE